MIGYINGIQDIDEVTDNPSDYNSGLLKRAINEAKVVYQHGNKPKAWYEQVQRICNAELASRGEATVS